MRSPSQGVCRREGLYSSLISEWRKQRDDGALQGLTDRTAGRPKKAAEGRLVPRPSRAKPPEEGEFSWCVFRWWSCPMRAVVGGPRVVCRGALPFVGARSQVSPGRRRCSGPC